MYIPRCGVFRRVLHRTGPIVISDNPLIAHSGKVSGMLSYYCYVFLLLLDCNFSFSINNCWAILSQINILLEPFKNMRFIIMQPSSNYGILISHTRKAVHPGGHSTMPGSKGHWLKGIQHAHQSFPPIYPTLLPLI